MSALIDQKCLLEVYTVTHMYIHAHRLYIYTQAHFCMWAHTPMVHTGTTLAPTLWGKTPREMGWGEKVLDAVVILRPDACLDHLSHLHISVLR